MSTRSVIARVGKQEGQFKGVYHHSDGMPTTLGKFLLELLHGHFKNDLSAMLRILIDEHTGWSTIVGKNFNLTPGYHQDYKKANPSCYCHGERSETSEYFTEKNTDSDIEWIYIFDAANNRLFIRDNRYDAEEIVDLTGAEPDWIKIECGEDFRRCNHYAWVHGLLPRSSNLGTQTYLGYAPLNFRDAIAFIVGGKRLSATGNGGNSNYFNSQGRAFPADAWIATLQSRKGRRLDVPVARITKNGYEPFPGVIWIYPPTRDNPEETMVGATEAAHAS